MRPPRLRAQAGVSVGRECCGAAALAAARCASTTHAAAPCLSRRAACLLIAAALPALSGPEHALSDESEAALDRLDASRDAQRYASGLRSAGRGANALIKKRAETGVERTESISNPLVAPGQILDELYSADRRRVSVSFAFPESWSFAKGPNLDVRDVRTADSTFLVVAPLPQAAGSGASDAISTLPASFFTDALFSKEGKYGSYGAVDQVKVTGDELVALSSGGRGGKQSYRLLKIKFEALTYNQNTVQRRALISATSVGGSVFILVSGCLSNRFKQAGTELEEIQKSFRAYSEGRSATSSA